MARRWEQVAENRSRFGIRRQLRLLAPLLGTWTAALVVLVLAGTQQSAPLTQLFLDASYLGGQPWYSGVLNEAGLISWAVAVTAAGLGSWVAAQSGRRGAARFLGWGGVVVAVMLTDIWIQFHSALAPRLGIASNLAQVAIAASGLSWFAAFWREIARTRWLVLVCSFGFLGSSAGIDTVIEPSGALGLWLEDGARLIGILTFTHYLVVTTVDIIRSVLAQHPAPAGASASAPPAVPRPRSPLRSSPGAATHPPRDHAERPPRDHAERPPRDHAERPPRDHAEDHVE